MAVDGHLNFDTKLDEKGFSSGIKKIGSIAKTGLKVIAGLAATGIGASAAVGASFEAEMSKVQAISGATSSELAALTAKAKEMGAKTKFSASESAQALEYMAMAGWKTGDMLGGLEGIMNLAAASGEDLALTSDIVTDALTAFGMKANQSGHFADILAAASSNANTNVAMMGETFKYVAPVAGALGYTAEDTALAIGLMANAGIKASQAGTSLRGILTRLAKPTDDVAGAMSSLGISITDSEGKVKPFGEVLDNLRESFSGLGEAEKAQYAATIAGQEGMSGLLAIVNASPADYEKLKKAIDNCDGSAEKMAATMQDNLKGSITILKSSLEGLGIEIYEEMEKPLRGMAEKGIQAVNNLSSAVKSGGTKALFGAGVVLLQQLLQGWASSLPSAMDSIVKSVEYFGDILISHAPSMVTAGFEIINALIDGIAQLFPVLGEIALNLISTLAQGIIANAPTLIPKGIETILQFAQGIINNLPALLEIGLQVIIALAQGIINSLPTLIELVPKLINTFCDTIYSFLPKILMVGIQLIAMLGKGIIESIPTIIANIGEILKAILNVIMSFSLFSQGKALINGMGKGIKSMFGAMKTHIHDLINLIKNPFNINWSSIGDNIVKGIANGIKNGAHAIVSAAKSAAKNALNAAKNFLGIHSPSTVFRDQVGKYMAQGIGVGFEKYMPEDDIGKDVTRIAERAQTAAVPSKNKVNDDIIQYKPHQKDDDNPETDGKPVLITVVNEIDGKVVSKKTVKYTDKELGLRKDLKDKGVI